MFVEYNAVKQMPWILGLMPGQLNQGPGHASLGSHVVATQLERYIFAQLSFLNRCCASGSGSLGPLRSLSH